jgi:glycosyltransferase involved in cell wall biosynthesis
MEAMATGLPVIATRVGGVPELVEADRTALMVEAGDETALRAAIARIMQDASLREALGRRGREVAEARFRIEAMCAAREAIFVEFASRSRRAASQGVGQT